MINIASIRQKDILENLIEGLMGIPEEKNDEQKEDKGKEESEKKKSKDKENKKEEKEKENKDVQNNTININNENKEKDVEKKKEESENKKEEGKKEENNIINDNSNEDLVNSTFVQKCFIALIRFVDTKTFKANEYKIYFNFNQFQKFQKMEKYIDKISFLIKFIDINYAKKSVNIDYKSLDNFNEKKWIKDFNKYNTQYLESLDDKQNTANDYHRMTAEYLGMTKNSIIQIEIYTPISLARTLNDSGAIKTDKIFMNNYYQDKAVAIGKDDILEMSKVFYDCYEEEQNKKT
jgi:hypothetical protein